jgi:hypothetical protein
MSPRSPRAFGLLIDPEKSLPAGQYSFGTEIEAEPQVLSGRARRLVALARALACSPVWKDMDGAILVARTTHPEGLAFLGSFSDEEAARLRWLPTQLESQLPYFRYVSWRQAEADVEELASQLQARFGPDEIRGMRFVGIPRGGLIVLGMLSYALGLGADCLGSDGDKERPLVVVDDCALSGLRFREFLRSHTAGAKTVLSAHLYSHPDLRRAIEDREPQVVAAVAARDLRDVGAELYGEELSAWQSRWAQRDGENVYMIGRFEHLAFPWSEPDLTFWDAAGQEARVGWRLVPPEACLKNRIAARSGPLRLQVQGREEGIMRLAPGTFHGEVDGRILVAELESGQVISLDGVAADIWREFLHHGTLDAALDRLQAQYQVPREELSKDAEAFLQELQARGFVTAAPVRASSVTKGTQDA